MNDNSVDRLHHVFFYGLYMDPDMLRAKGVVPRNPRLARVDDYELRIGNKATLLRARGKAAHGLVYALTHAEIDSLYRGAGLTEYEPEAVLATIDGDPVAVSCCNLLTPPAAAESNPGYREKLLAAMEKLGVPSQGV